MVFLAAEDCSKPSRFGTGFFLQKLSPPLQNQHGLVEPKKNIDLKKGTSSEANLPDLRCKSR